MKDDKSKSRQTTLSGGYQATLTGDVVQTELVNVSEHGREGVRMIDRSTQFGNPFRMKKDGGEYSREGCVEAYREWFKDKIRTDPEFQQAVEELRGETLACWCVSEPITQTEEPYDTCHGEILLAYLNGEIDI
ncbi:DUF4326 domain-containing protein [Halocatena halophila]|uniref:DUF4326 domain-containing protein n=1 Tax=Halocatena halophila TaxID=2814576 RepID=UPI002ED5C443